MKQIESLKQYFPALKEITKDSVFEIPVVLPTRKTFFIRMYVLWSLVTMLTYLQSSSTRLSLSSPFPPSTTSTITQICRPTDVYNSSNPWKTSSMERTHQSWQDSLWSSPKVCHRSTTEYWAALNSLCWNATTTLWCLFFYYHYNLLNHFKLINTPNTSFIPWFREQNVRADAAYAITYHLHRAEELNEMLTNEDLYKEFFDNLEGVKNMRQLRDELRDGNEELASTCYKPSNKRLTVIPKYTTVPDSRLIVPRGTLFQSWK